MEVEQKQVKEGNQIKILYLEHPFERSVSIPGIDFPIKLIGAIDRIDLYNETLRIIDYKTGKIELKHLKLPSWDVFDEQTEYAYLFQILLYSYVQKSLISLYPKASAGIISFRNLPQYFMAFSHVYKEDKLLNPEILNRFEVTLFKIINEIFDSKVNSPTLKLEQFFSGMVQENIVTVIAASINLFFKSFKSFIIIKQYNLIYLFF